MPGPVLPSRPGPGRLEPLRGSVTLRGGPLQLRHATNAAAGLAHGWQMLEASGLIGNFELVAGSRGAYSGATYADSDVFKWVEAAFWQRQQGLAADLEVNLCRAVGLIARAQMPDGYLNTYVQTFASGARWSASNPHEFYNLGHLLQAAVAASRSAGGERLLEVAVRAADQAERTCTGEANLWHLGHPGIEMALTELFRATGEARYLDFAERILHWRGERKDVLIGSGLSEWEDVLLPTPWDTSLKGHAVCALYLLAGMTDLYAERGDERVLQALDAKWDDMVLRKSYLTGNIGSRHAGEAVGHAYELPSARAYCETCAAVAIAMWSWRLLLLRGEARYADYFERVLYNALFTGVSLDGTKFFYSNPLESHGDIQRSPWFRCPCCPTNVMRALAQLAHYIVTQDQSGVQVHQFAPAEVSTPLEGVGSVSFSMSTRFPLDGTVTLAISEPGQGEWALRIRRPEWCVGEPKLTCTGSRWPSVPEEVPGYLTLRRRWTAGDRVEVEFPMAAQFIAADWRARDLRDSLAVTRGPLVYCAESHDQSFPFDGESVRLLPDDGLGEEHEEGELGEHLVVTASARLAQLEAKAALYRPFRGRERRRAAGGRGGAVRLRLVPYHLWANRGPAQMRVWFEAGRN